MRALAAAWSEPEGCLGASHLDGACWSGVANKRSTATESNYQPAYPTSRRAFLGSPPLHGRRLDTLSDLKKG